MGNEKIGHVFAFVSRGKSPKYVDNSVVQVINQACIRWDGIDFSKVKYQDPEQVKPDAILNEGDLLICSTGTGTLGRCCVFVPYDKDTVYVADSHVTILRGSERILPTFAKYYFMCESTQIKLYARCVNGSTNQIELSKEKLIVFHIPAPSIYEQRVLTSRLEQLEDLISLRKQQLAKLDELVKSRFIELFGDPLLDDGRYPKVPFGALADVGSSKRIFEKEYVSEGVPFYRTKEIVELSKGNCITTELFIARDRYDEIRNEYGVPQKGDLLISAVGTIGVIWIVDGKNDFYFKDGNLLRVSATEKFAPSYLKHLLEALIGAYKQEMSSGTAYAALTISALKEMLVYKVPIAEQEQFASFVEQTDKSKLAIQRSLEKLETLKKALMQKYFG